MRIEIIQLQTDMTVETLVDKVENSLEDLTNRVTTAENRINEL